MFRALLASVPLLALLACSSGDGNLCAALESTPTGCPIGQTYAYLCSSPRDGEPVQPTGADCTELPTAGGAVWCCSEPE